MTSDFKPTKPDYVVSALDKNSDMKGNIGSAWKTPEGNIRIKLNPFVVLDTREHDLVITLFPANGGPGPKLAASVRRTNPDNEPDPF